MADSTRNSAGATAREARLAAALKANLRKRKAQARARAGAGDGGESHGEGDVPEPAASLPQSRGT